MSFVKQVVDKAKPYGYEIVLTGHSLGGGLAAYAALACEQQAVVFNAAGMGKGLRSKIFANLYDFEALVKRVDLNGDPVSALGNRVGTTYTLQVPASMIGQNGFVDNRSLVTGPLVALNPDAAGKPHAVTINPIAYHSIDTVVKVLQSIAK